MPTESDLRAAKRVVLTVCDPSHWDYEPSDGDEVDENEPAPVPPFCAETGEPVEFCTTHDYRTDYRWRYASGALCVHRVIR